VYPAWAAAPTAAAYIRGACIAVFGRYGIVAPLGGDYMQISILYKNLSQPINTAIENVC